MKLGTLIPTFSALLHLRIMFSLFLLPVFLFALSQVPEVDIDSAWLAFFIWHFLVYPASNGYNSYFDKDEGSIALIEKPPQVDPSLYYLSLFLDALALLLSFFAGWAMVIGVLVYGLFSKLYSHPAVRLKKYPLISFLVVFIFQGAFIYWTSFVVISRTGFDGIPVIDFILTGAICSFLIGASYPLTQVYQHKEDRRRGDKTLSLILGVRGSFKFSALLFFAALCLSCVFWMSQGRPFYFLLFVITLLPVKWFFLRWYLKVLKDSDEANYKNMSKMTLLSSIMMLLYFGLLNFI